MNLAETQELFFKLVTGQEHSAQGVSYAPFSGSAELPADQRVEIYANMYRWRLVDAILADFPKLARLLDGDFLPLCSEYLRHHPSENPDIGKIGRCLPQFLRHRQAGLLRPDLGDLAALEWARCEVFSETDALAIDRSRLTSISPQAFVSLRLSFVPALRVLGFEHDVARLWTALEEEQPAVPPCKEPISMAIWRQDFTVFHATLKSDEAPALRAAIAGETMEQVCGFFAHRESPVEAAFAVISSWFSDGWVRGLSAGER